MKVVFERQFADEGENEHPETHIELVNVLDQGGETIVKQATKGKDNKLELQTTRGLRKCWVCSEHLRSWWRTQKYFGAMAALMMQSHAFSSGVPKQSESVSVEIARAITGTKLEKSIAPKN